MISVTIRATEAACVAHAIRRIYRSVKIDVIKSNVLMVTIPATVADPTYYLRELMGTLVTFRMDGRIDTFITTGA